MTAAPVEVVLKKGQSLYDATHVIFNGALQPLYFDARPVEGPWPSYGRPFIVVSTVQKDFISANRINITPSMLPTLPLLRLPADEKEVAALLASGAVRGAGRQRQGLPRRGPHIPGHAGQGAQVRCARRRPAACPPATAQLLSE
jgi:hypothetical protein